jgi:hypothetical protein
MIAEPSPRTAGRSPTSIAARDLADLKCDADSNRILRNTSSSGGRGSLRPGGDVAGGRRMRGTCSQQARTTCRATVPRRGGCASSPSRSASGRAARRSAGLQEQFREVPAGSGSIAPCEPRLRLVHVDRPTVQYSPARTSRAGSRGRVRHRCCARVSRRLLDHLGVGAGGHWGWTVLSWLRPRESRSRRVRSGDSVPGSGAGRRRPVDSSAPRSGCS